jgi:hypothetical protein
VVAVRGVSVSGIILPLILRAEQSRLGILKLSFYCSRLHLVLSLSNTFFYLESDITLLVRNITGAAIFRSALVDLAVWEAI